MKNYKFALTLKGKVIARSQSKEGITKRFIEMYNYLNDKSIIVKAYKGSSDELDVIEIDDVK